MTWQMVVAGFLVVLCGYTLGAIFARVVCLTGDKVIAISIETALQNPGVAFILLKLSLESPYRWGVLAITADRANAVIEPELRIISCLQLTYQP